MSTDGTPPALALLQQALGFWISRAICVVARLGIADLLKDGPLDTETLAAARRRLPTVYNVRANVVEAGGLLSYAADVAVLYRRAATYVAKILTGTRVSDLPVEQPTEFELVINAKTAKGLGLTIPPSLLLRADQVIE